MLKTGLANFEYLFAFRNEDFICCARPHKDFGLQRTWSTLKAEIRGERRTTEKRPFYKRKPELDHGDEKFIRIFQGFDNHF